MQLSTFTVQSTILPAVALVIQAGHRSCKKVLPLDFASKNIKNSSLLIGTLEDIKSLIDTVQKLIENRNDNLKSLDQAKSLISQQINTVKLRLLKQIDDLTHTLLTQLMSVQKINKIKIERQKEEMSKLESNLRKNKDELEFFKSHGSNNQLFLSLLQIISNNRNREVDLQRRVSSAEEIVIEFDEINQFSLDKMGSISENTKSCTVPSKCRRLFQAHIQTDVIKSLNVFEKSTGINLESAAGYNLTDMAVTSNNMLLLSNYCNDYPNIRIYRDCKDYENEIQCSSGPYGITVIPDTDTTVVTLPGEKSIQFCNTTNMTLGNKVQLGFKCWGITATNDNIIVGGYGVVHILDMHGSKISEVTVGGSDIYSIRYDKANGRLLCRYSDGMCCVTLKGKPVYQYKVTRQAGLAVDQQGHVYLSHKPNEIHRLSSNGKFRDVVLITDHGFNYPYALSFNNDFTQLFVVNSNIESVSVFRCK